MTDDEPAFLTQGPLRRLRELQTLLADHDIPAEIVAPPGASGNA